MKIVKEGIYILIFSLAAIIISLYWARFYKVLYILTFISGILFLFSLYFFRDPQRNKQFSENEIASPADGTVLSVKTENGFTVIRIFLSVFNVHLQRSPIDGKIIETKFTYGKFHIAYKPQAKDNQRNMIKIEGKDGKWAFVEQITGAIARRIACYVKEGDTVKIGQKIGMIYFGSQVALYLPQNAVITVKEGDKVFAGETIIGLWKTN